METAVRPAHGRRCGRAVARLVPRPDRHRSVLLRLGDADRLRASRVLHRPSERVTALRAPAARARRGRPGGPARAACRRRHRDRPRRSRQARASMRQTGSRRASVHRGSVRRLPTGSTAPSSALRRTSSCRSRTTSSARAWRAGTAMSATSPSCRPSRRIPSRARSRASPATAASTSAPPAAAPSSSTSPAPPSASTDVSSRDPSQGLVAYRLVPGTTRVKWLAKGLASDGWTGTTLRYQAWPIRPGRYDVTLAIPSGTEPRRVRIGDRTLTVVRGKPRRLTVPTDGRPLELKIEVPNAPLGGRVLGVKVLALRFAPA